MIIWVLVGEFLIVVSFKVEQFGLEFYDELVLR